MKQKNVAKRLKSRQDAWDNMRADSGSAKKKQVGKQSFNRPGSNKK